jgi:hypothetical protein
MKEQEYLIEIAEGIKLDGLNDCIVGTNECNHLVYCYEKIKEKLMSEGMDDDEAIDYIDFNIVGLLPMGGFSILYNRIDFIEGVVRNHSNYYD